MKRVINKKIYDSDKAEMIGEFENIQNQSDFRYCSERLYITKKKNYFLVYSGGPKSKYAETQGNQTWGTHGINPLTKNEALEWAEQYCNGNIVEKYFKEMIEEA